MNSNSYDKMFISMLLSLGAWIVHYDPIIKKSSHSLEIYEYTRSLARTHFYRSTARKCPLSCRCMCPIYHSLRLNDRSKWDHIST